MQFASQDPLFVGANLAEACLWLAIGTGFFIAGLRRPQARRGLWVLAAAFWVFGASDVIESRTGAWWRPWWLLAMKAGCLLIFLVALIQYVRMKHISGTTSDGDDCYDK